MGGRPGGNASPEKVESRGAVPVDGGGRVVEIRLGGTSEGQDWQSSGGGVRAHPEAG